MPPIMASMPGSHRPERLDPRATSAGAADVVTDAESSPDSLADPFAGSFPAPFSDPFAALFPAPFPGWFPGSAPVAVSPPAPSSSVGSVDARVGAGHDHRLAACSGESTERPHATTMSTRPYGSRDPASAWSSAPVTRVGRPAAVSWSAMARAAARA